MSAGVAKLEKRLNEVKALNTAEISDSQDPRILALNASVKLALQEVFGGDTSEYFTFAPASGLYEFKWSDSKNDSYTGVSRTDVRAGVERGFNRAKALLAQAISLLKEKILDLDENDAGSVLKAYEGLELHPEIDRAASGLYRDGHYPNAILDAVKSLNGLVRLRSGRDDLDGTNLMETVFSPNKPILKFNDMADQSDRDEQKGFMMMFSGAVAGLRNPRAHKFIKDDAERALEFIAFVSLLAKLLDEAKK